MRKVIKDKATGEKTKYVYRNNGKKVVAKVVKYGAPFKSGTELITPKVSKVKVKRILK